VRLTPLTLEQDESDADRVRRYQKVLRRQLMEVLIIQTSVFETTERMKETLEALLEEV
jgi:hypothetical protein